MLHRTRTHGRPGRSPHRLAKHRRRTGALALAGGVLAGATLLVAGAPIPGLAALAGGWLINRRTVARARRALAGRDAEVEVARRLRRVRASRIVFNARLPGRGGDIDAVVLGPVAATIEVKLGSGRVQCRGDGRVTVDRRLLPGAPLRQALAHAAGLRQAAQLPVRVDAVLCVTGMRQRPRLVAVGNDEVWVTSARHLPRVLRRLPRELDGATAMAAADLIR